MNKKKYIFFFQTLSLLFLFFFFQNLLLTIYQVFIFLLALILYHVLEIGKISWKGLCVMNSRRVSWYSLLAVLCENRLCQFCIFSLVLFTLFLKKIFIITPIIIITLSICSCTVVGLVICWVFLLNCSTFFLKKMKDLLVIKLRLVMGSWSIKE